MTDKSSYKAGTFTPCSVCPHSARCTESSTCLQYGYAPEHKDALADEIEEREAVRDAALEEAAKAAAYERAFMLETVTKRLREELAQARARCAELEKVVECSRALCKQFSWSRGMDDNNPAKGNGNRLADAIADLDAALKEPR